MIVSPGEGLLRLLKVFDRLEIAYTIGGSGASSVHGLVRTTGDIDMVARIGLPDVRSLVTDLRQDFYIEEEQVRTALEHFRSFNVIYLRNSYKFDILPLTADRYQQVQFGRRRHEMSSLFKG
jgi:hypothetical protein